MSFIDCFLLFGINLDGRVSTKLGPGEYGGGKYPDNLKLRSCPITSTSSLKYFVQRGGKVSHSRTEIGPPFSPLLGDLSLGILAHSDMYKKWAATEKEKNSQTETLENPQSQNLRIGCTEMEEPQTTHHSGNAPYTNYRCFYNERENEAVNCTGAASCRESGNVTPRRLTWFTSQIPL